MQFKPQMGQMISDTSLVVTFVDQCRFLSTCVPGAQFKEAQEAALAKEENKKREAIKREVERLEKEDASLGKLDNAWTDYTRSVSVIQQALMPSTFLVNNFKAALLSHQPSWKAFLEPTNAILMFPSDLPEVCEMGAILIACAYSWLKINR